MLFLIYCMLYFLYLKQLKHLNSVEVKMATVNKKRNLTSSFICQYTDRLFKIGCNNSKPMMGDGLMGDSEG